jgi:hypothetical protein
VTAPGVGELVLQEVEQIEWEKLTEADAMSDGFESLEELNRAIRRIYPNLEGDGKNWFRLKFKPPAPLPSGKRVRLASAVRKELDKAVAAKGSLARR